jgi:hypothetical protein
VRHRELRRIQLSHASRLGGRRRPSPLSGEYRTDGWRPLGCLRSVSTIGCGEQIGERAKRAAEFVVPLGDDRHTQID